jgi:hypothetical protein
MPALLTIRETSSGLVMHVHETRRYPRIVLSLLIDAIVMYFFLRAGSGTRFVILFVGVLVAVQVVRDALSHFRGTDVTLSVGNLDFSSSGHAPAGYRPSITSRADIYGLAFRKASGGGESAEYPQGLYAEHGTSGIWNDGTCLLPHLDEAQVNEAIEAILRRFPDTGTLASPKGRFESDLISLNLNRP